MPRNARTLISRTLALALLALAGCHLIDAPELASEASLLQAASSAPQAATLEIYWATLPEPDHDAEEALWGCLQENRFSPDLRRRLAINGLRAGVISGAMPDEIHELLNPTGGEGEGPVQTNAVLQQTGVWRRTRQLRQGDHLELKACEPKASAPLLVARDGELVGETLSNAQAFYKLKAEDLSGGQCVLSLTPEVRHGVAKPRWTPDETGVISQATPSQDATVFTDLSIEASLSAGEALLVTSLRDAPSLLGGYFHQSAADSEGRRKAILIRVVQAPRSADFPPIESP